MLVNALHPSNIKCISVTLPVSKLLRSRLVNASHPKNIQFISVTLLVSKLLRSRLVNALQVLNIWFISVTLLASNCPKSILFRFVQPTNIELVSVNEGLPTIVTDSNFVLEKNRPEAAPITGYVKSELPSPSTTVACP